jgi:hypothetical protein
MKLSSKIKTLLENNLMSFERRSLLKRLQSMIMEGGDTSIRGSSTVTFATRGHVSRVTSERENLRRCWS